MDEMKILVNGSHLTSVEASEETTIPIHEGFHDSFSGSVSLLVSDETPLGAFLRPNLYVSFLRNTVIKYQTTILGEYVYLALPEMEVFPPVPGRIDMKEKAEFRGNLQLPTGPMETSLLKVFMPNNVTFSRDAADLYIEEPFLSATKFEIASNAGLLKESVEMVGKISPWYMSNSRSSETDQVSVALPELKVQSGSTGELHFVMEAEMLDFAGSSDDMELLIGYVLEVGDGIFVIQNTSLFTKMNDEIPRKPSLDIFADLGRVLEDEERYNILLELGLEHNIESWGSAYNISWFVYLPAYLNNILVGRTDDILRSTRRTYNNRIVLDSSVFEFQLKRLSFVHSSRVVLNMTLDPNHTEFDESHMTIYVEAVYNNWRSMEDFATSEAFSFKIGDHQEPLQSCRCNNEISFECMCGNTKENGCDAIADGIRCVDCNTPWKCVKTLPGYGMKSRMNDKQGNKYKCGKAERNRKLASIRPCVRIDKNGTASELSQTLGTLVGENISGRELYGISRNGLSYMLSQDNGHLWFSIQPDIYKQATRSNNFIPASFF